MQPLMIPDIPPLVAYGSIALFSLSLLLIALAQQEMRTWRRMGAALVIVLLIAGVSISASQPVQNPCASCAAAEGTWLWYFLLCFTCP